MKFQEQVEELLGLQDQIDVQMAALDTCQYSAHVLEAILVTIQKAVDSMSLGQFSNLSTWVQRLDEDVIPFPFFLSECGHSRFVADRAEVGFPSPGRYQELDPSDGRKRGRR